MRKEIKIIGSLIFVSLFLLAGCTDTPQTNLNEDQTLDAGKMYTKELSLSSSAKVNVEMTSDQAVDVFLFNYHNYEKFKSDESIFSYFSVGSKVNTDDFNTDFDLPSGQWIIVVDNTPSPSFGAEGNQPANVNIKITTQYLTQQVGLPDSTKIWVSEDIFGEEISLGDFSNKPSLVYFMSLATYPATTINQMYQLISAYEQLNVNVLCVEMESNLKQVQQLIDNFKDTNEELPFTFTFDDNEAIRNQYNKNNKFPYIVVIDEHWDIKDTLESEPKSAVITFKTIQESINDL